LSDEVTQVVVVLVLKWFVHLGGLSLKINVFVVTTNIILLRTYRFDLNRKVSVVRRLTAFNSRLHVVDRTTSGPHGVS